MALTSAETILAILNVIFVIIAIFLFVRLRKTGKKDDTEIKQLPELESVTDITPNDFKSDIFGIKKQDIAPSEKPVEAVSKVKIGQKEKTALALEDELPEVEEKPAKKESKKKKSSKKLLDEVIEKAIIKETGAPPEKILIPEKEEKPEIKESKKKKPAKKEPEKEAAIKEKAGSPPGKIQIPEKFELKFEETIPEKEEKQEIKEGKKKKPAKKETGEAAPIKEVISIPSDKIQIPEKIEFKFEETIPEKEEKPEKKESKKKKPSKKEEIVEEVVIEEPKSPKKKAAEPTAKTRAGKETVKVKKVEEKAAKKPSKKKK